MNRTKDLDNISNKANNDIGIKRNGEIDVLRFVFSVLIVIFHFNDNFKLQIMYFGNIAVEFFFLVSGYLMAMHANKKIKQNEDIQLSISDETWKYTLNKVKSFYMYYIGAFIIQIIVRFILVKNEGVASIVYNLLKSVPVVSLLFMRLGTNDTQLYVPNTWFLFAMLIAVFILYPILLWRNKSAIQWILPLLSLSILMYMKNTYNKLSVWGDWEGPLYSGVIRAIGEMALGCCLYPLSILVIEKKSQSNSSGKVSTNLLLTVIKITCYAIVLIFSSGKIGTFVFDRSFDFHALLFCAIGIILSFASCGYTIPATKITGYLGKSSLPIFI